MSSHDDITEVIRREEQQVGADLRKERIEAEVDDPDFRR